MITDPRIGSEIAGYRIESVLGRGGMSVVYLAEHLRLHRKAALKLLASDLAEDHRFRDRFIRESELAAGLDHPNIVPVYEAGEAEGLLFIAMRYVRGTDLKSLISSEGALEPRRALRIAWQVAGALDAAHAEGLVHRDVKPGNVLIQAGTEGEPDGHVYLSDFGVTKRVSSDSGITATGQFVGTLDYAAPEQIQGQPLDGRTDQYSLGCVLFECLAGQVPFGRDSEMALLWAHVYQAPPSLSSLRPELPLGLDSVMQRAMAKAADDRYPSCRAFVNAASQALGVAPAEEALPATERVAVGEAGPVGHGAADGAPSPSTPIRPVPPVSTAAPVPARPPPARRRRRLVAAGVAVVVIASAVVVGVALTSGKGETKHPAKTPSAVPLLVNSAARIDPARDALVADVPAGDQAAGIAVGQGSVWIVSHGESNVWRIDPASGRVLAKIALDHQPQAVAVGAGAVWVTGGGSVFRIDPSTNEVIKTIDVGGDFLYAVAVGGGVPGVWVVDGANGTVDRIDPATNHVVIRVGVGRNPTSVAVGEGSVWVTDSDSNALRRIDPYTNQIVKTLPVATLPIDVTVGGGSVIVVNKGDDTMWTIDPNDYSVFGTTDLPGAPTAVAIGEGAVWVTTTDSLVRVDPVTGLVQKTIRLRPTPADVAVGSGAVWVSVYG